jgi:AraC-like DNA-binding protein
MAGQAQDPAAGGIRPAPRGMAPGVSSMVGYRSPAAPSAVHRGLPSSRLTFIVSLDQGVEAGATETEARSARPNPLLLAGLHTTASHVRRERAQCGIQLAVHPLAARTLFGVPAAALPVSGYDGAEVLGRWAVELQEQLAEAWDGGGSGTARDRTAEADPAGSRACGSGPVGPAGRTESSPWADLFARTAQALLASRTAHADSAPAVRPELRRAWHLLERSGGRASVRELASDTGLSTRRLGTLFVQEVGLSPKRVAGLIRFERATRLIARQVAETGRTDLAAAAARAGFSDQSHLSREFLRHSGLSPRAWAAEEFRNIQDGGHGAAAD